MDHSFIQIPLFFLKTISINISEQRGNTKVKLLHEFFVTEIVKFQIFLCKGKRNI